MNRYSLSNLDFNLPVELIRQSPPLKRSNCRLMILNSGVISHSSFPKIINLFSKGDTIILNRTKVRKSLVYATKQTGGKVSITFLEKTESGFTAFIRGKVRDGDRIELSGRDVRVSSLGDGKRLISGQIDWDFIEKIGHLPLPPYIKKRADYSYYQNEIGNETNSIAAPTASLHFDRLMLNKLANNGVKVLYVLLGVGYGTFKGITSEDIREHIVDEEEIEVPEDTVSQIENAKGNLVAVGTTVVRSLETASLPGKVRPYRGRTRIFIYPGWKFNSNITHLLTNFHIPRSSLLSLVYAFGSEGRIKQAYEEAIREKYYFYSLGDAMLIDRWP